jgi:hypothetical protein
LGFLYQRFSSLLRDEACQFRNQQSRTVPQHHPNVRPMKRWRIAAALG